MRHRVHSRTLGRQTGHRLSMLRNLATALLEHKRIKTTEIRAKELASYVETVIERAKKAQRLSGNKEKAGEALAHKRAVFAVVRSRRDPENPNGTKQKYPRTASRDRTVANQLFTQIATRYLEGPGKEERKGGYTRITRLENRKGDGALVVLVELV
jgi:large subunit ribosomal protein L17